MLLGKLNGTQDLVHSLGVLKASGGQDTMAQTSTTVINQSKFIQMDTVF